MRSEDGLLAGGGSSGAVLLKKRRTSGRRSRLVTSSWMRTPGKAARSTCGAWAVVRRRAGQAGGDTWAHAGAGRRPTHAVTTTLQGNLAEPQPALPVGAVPGEPVGGAGGGRTWRAPASESQSSSSSWPACQGARRCRGTDQRRPAPVSAASNLEAQRQRTWCRPTSRPPAPENREVTFRPRPCCCIAASARRGSGVSVGAGRRAGGRKEPISRV